MASEAMPEVERYYESYIKYGFEKTLSNNRELINPEDEALIRRFIKSRIAQKRIGIATQTKIGALLVYWKRYIKKPYSQLEYQDIEDGLNAFNEAKTAKGKPYSQNHQREMIIKLKGFLYWLIDERIIKVDIKKIRKIDPPKINVDTDRAENLFTPDEIKQIAAACTKNSHKAFIWMSYETGARPGEIARLRWKDIAVNKNSIQVTITDKKTKKERTAFVIVGKEYLLRHASDLPSMDLEDYIFKNSDGKPLDPHNAFNIVYNAKKKADVKKKFKLKLFRKSRVSNMMKEGYNDGAIREQIWGNQGTTMFKVYAKYSPGDIEKAMLIKAGIEPEEQPAESPTKPRTCHICGKVNEPDAKWCPSCGTPLTEAAKADVKDAKTEARELFKKLLQLKLDPAEYEQLLNNL